MPNGGKQLNRFVRSLILFIILFAGWLLMSGHYTPLLIGLGVLSCALATWLAHMINATDSDGLPLHLFARLPGYLLWLLREIIMSNIATGRIILFGRARPELFTTNAAQATQSGLVTYANSITLTPGTVTIEIVNGGDTEFLVHSLDPIFTKDVMDGEMNRRVTALEKGGGT